MKWKELDKDGKSKVEATEKAVVQNNLKWRALDEHCIRDIKKINKDDGKMCHFIIYPQNVNI